MTDWGPALARLGLADQDWGPTYRGTYDDLKLRWRGKKECPSQADLEAALALIASEPPPERPTTVDDLVKALTDKRVLTVADIKAAKS